MICFVRDIPIYYEEYGEGKPILCIHGYSVDHRLMTGCLEPVFVDMKGFRRIYLDLPGMGKTPSASWIRNADDMLDILKEFIKTVISDQSFLLIGESYGGYLTLGLIRDMQSKIDGAMLICPVVSTENRRLPSKCTLWKSEHLDTVADNSSIDEFMNMAVIATPELYEKYKRDIQTGVELADSDFLSRYSTEGYGFSCEDDLMIEFDKPMCILTGRQDHVVGYLNAFEVLDKFPRATFAVLDCAGHNLQIENEPLFVQHIKDWIWRIELGS